MQFETFAKRLFFAVLLVLHTLLLLLTPPQPRLAYFYSLPSSLALALLRKVFTRIPIWRDDDDKLKTRHQQSAA